MTANRFQVLAVHRSGRERLITTCTVEAVAEVFRRTVTDRARGVEGVIRPIGVVGSIADLDREEVKAA